MRNKLKTARILVPVLLLFVLLSSTSLVVAAERLTFEYAVTGKIKNNDTGAEASMSLTLKGTLTLGNPDYISWTDWRDQERGWKNYGGGEDRGFWWNDDLSWIPQWVFDQVGNLWIIEGHQYRVHIEWDNHENWWAHFQSWDTRWYTPKGSWSGKLIVGWEGGSAPETWSVSLSPLTLQENEEEGNMYINSGKSWRHEHWEIYWINTGANEQNVGLADNPNIPIGGGFTYHSKSLQISFNGKYSIKKKSLLGRLSLQENRFWIIDPNPSQSIGVNGNGGFGPYSFNFPV
jgi:hypothetical protein